MKLHGAEIVIETIIEQGCDTVFGYPGGAVLDLYDALYMRSDRIRHVITAHEQGAAHAADGYARATGRVGVVIATSGPGATNLVTGIATAMLDSTPMVAITGNVGTSMIGRDSFQEVDIMGITIPITKHNYIVKDIDSLADTIREAFRIAKSGRPGPVLVDIPKDIQQALAEYDVHNVVEPMPAKSAKQDLLEQAAAAIAKAKRPFIYCGGGVTLGDAGDELVALAEKIDAPVGCSLMGLSAIPSDHPKALGMQGMHGKFASSRAMAKSDCIIAAGVRFSDRATGNKEAFSKGKTVIHLDTDAAEINKNIPANLGIIGAIKDSVARLCELVEKKTNDDWTAEVEQYKEKGEALVQKSMQGSTLHPYAVIDAVKKFAPADTVVATDVGQHQMWVAQRYPMTQKRSLITSGGLGTMGFGMGAAIGAAMGSGKPAVMFTGDGSFGMNLNEMATMVSQNLPMVVVVLNNGVLGMVRQWQTLFYDKHYAQTTLGRKTDFVKLAEAFGAKAFRATTVEEMEAAAKEAFALKAPVLIEAIIDPDEMVLPMVPPGGTIDQMMADKPKLD